MDKNLIIENAENKFHGELLDIVLKQIEDYFELYNSDYIIKNNYQIGDSVSLNKNHLLHGIGNHNDLIDTFAERGIISPDFFGNNLNHGFCYNSAFWIVNGNISLQEYIKNYSGMVVNINKQYYQVPYKELDNFVETVRNVDHWSWTAESSMEIRFMPSLARDINQIGFILNTENDIAKRMRKNSVFKDNFNKEYAYEFVSHKNKTKEEFLNSGYDNDFFERADYIIFGLPKNCIEGVIVGRQVEHNKEYLKILKSLFPNCYICSLDGIVIK